MQISKSINNLNPVKKGEVKKPFEINIRKAIVNQAVQINKNENLCNSMLNYNSTNKENFENIKPQKKRQSENMMK